MKKKIRVGQIGLGGRGLGLLQNVILLQEDVEVVAVCDLYEDRMQVAAEAIKEKRGYSPVMTDNYH